ncbi:MAG: hypothetical protein KAY32_15520 [Candidatus Eisenbacteria sp.]|nr:hypothetical protein [Candidatus Eisenbacteria bacterium]
MTQASHRMKRLPRAESAGEAAGPRRMIFPVMDASQPPREIPIVIEGVSEPPRTIHVEVEECYQEPRRIRVHIEDVSEEPRILRVPIVEVDPADLRRIGPRRPGWPNAGRGQSEA